jgi:hypothetical protein
MLEKEYRQVTKWYGIQLEESDEYIPEPEDQEWDEYSTNQFRKIQEEDEYNPEEEKTFKKEEDI